MKSKIAVMQPYFFPYIGYFQLINSVDKFVILDDVNYIKKGWINRNYILVNSKPCLFTIPLVKPSQNKLINETEIAFESNWKKKFLKTIETGYAKAPFFQEVFDMLAVLMDSREKNLSKFILLSQKKVIKYLGLKTQIIESSVTYSNSHLKGEQRITDICRKENSSVYINLPGGTDLYSKNNFNNEGIDLYFIKSDRIEYRQFKNEFAPSLSMIDVMMFNSKESINQFLNSYELV